MLKKLQKKYDEVKNINSVESGIENISMEWMYNYIYRFQCLSAHQSLRDKEKVFNLFESNNKKPDNTHILGLLDDVVEKTLNLHMPEKG